MPRGNPRRNIMLRLLPELIDAVRASGAQINRAVEDGLRLWLARAERERRRREREKINDNPKDAA